MRHLYRVLASQFDPLSYILPYTTRAKIIVQHLWGKTQDWDDPNLPHNLLEAWLSWESELPALSTITLPRCFTQSVDPTSATYDLYIFCDASEQSYGAVLLTCVQKMFSRVAEIQELTKGQEWHYVNSQNNPANDLTRGKLLADLGRPCRWNQGPAFLFQPLELWPINPDVFQSDDPVELRKLSFCGAVSLSPYPSVPDPSQFATFQDLLNCTTTSLHGVANPPSAENYCDAETAILRQAQMESFKDDLACLQNQKPLLPSSRLLSLAPELDPTSGLVRVGGRLHQSSDLLPDAVHPVVLDPAHPITS
ncbi:Gamma-glutamyl phosphate reductase [Labeo rohita]|uniref:Gamma-glutamyl phosphate reductase n=1 Tax=Labeo rohita TaxID=84645 RepID=A0ABQ8L588_LABRO|nr:Gamma-glutamyl phosphate reductase [Labeo rohita]